jgi:hypothetical protein
MMNFGEIARSKAELRGFAGKSDSSDDSVSEEYAN